MTVLRTFIAIELDEPLRYALRAVRDRLEPDLPPRSVRWVDPVNTHLTLKFLGDTPSDKVDAIHQALVDAVAGFAPFTFTAAGLGCFPNIRRPNVIWIGVEEPGGTLARLQVAVEAAVAPLGWHPEKKPFHPHLTLARVRRNVGGSERRAIGEVVARSDLGELGTVSVSGIALIRSDLRPTGPVYTQLAWVTLVEER